MQSTKRKQSDMEASCKVPPSSVKKRRRPQIKFPEAPPINSLRDLIKVGQSIVFYKNLDMPMLWRITPYLEELDAMIGMESLKKSLFYQIIYYIQGMHTRNKNEEYLHTIIFGPPGTGKTTVSQIIGKIYKSMDILSNTGVFKVAHREDFVAEYLGQTAIKTKKLLKSCLGGVLFIDEVYALGPQSSDRDSFAKEALDTLTAFLSEHKNDFCCIAAGYEEDIRKCFFGMNRGLERRFPWVHTIEEYTPDNLADIMLKMIGDIGWEINMDRREISQLIMQNKEYFKYAGGDIEVLLTKSKMSHAKRVFNLEKCHKFILTKQDLIDGIEMVKESKKNIKDDEPPYGMYI